MMQRADSIAEFVVTQIRNFLLHYFMHQLVSIHFNVVTCSDVKQNNEGRDDIHHV